MPSSWDLDSGCEGYKVFCKALVSGKYLDEPVSETIFCLRVLIEYATDERKWHRSYSSGSGAP